MSINLAYIKHCRSEIADTAQQMLNSDISYIEGSRKILQCLDGARINGQQEPFNTFVAIESETAAFPAGIQFEHWADATIVGLLPIWNAAEARAKRYGEEACRETISWLNDNPIDFD